MDPRLSSFMPSHALVPSTPAVMATPMTAPGPTSEPVLHKKQKTRGQTGYGLGPLAPSVDIPFPARANITAVELLTFLPLTIQCPDVIYRLITNGGTRMVIWSILNTQRELAVELSANCCGIWMSKAMNKAGYAGWTISTHGRFHEQNGAAWDEGILGVGGFRTPGQLSGPSDVTADIPFKNLALDVSRVPTGYDALDLTRMVQYCVQKPDELWLYPRDYEILLGRLGGPAPVQKHHTDRAAFLRWDGLMPPAPRLSNPGIRLRDTTPALTLSSRDATPMSTIRSRGATPTPAVVAKRGRPRAAPKKAVISEVPIEEEQRVLEEDAVTEPYIRNPAEYVSPPEHIIEPADRDVELAFAKERDADEHEAHSPYAFGGPRNSPPYRMLHRIYQPHPADRSGWAENLRWAFEQQACFSFGHRAKAWNESPEHMELIAETRKRQVWASDELVELLVKDQLREKENKRFVY